MVTSTASAGTYRDFDKRRSARLSKECIQVTHYKCVEIGTRSGWMYVEVGDFVKLDVANDAGERDVQVAEVKLPALAHTTLDIVSTGHLIV